jgi:hypothetical protein
MSNICSFLIFNADMASCDSLFGIGAEKWDPKEEKFSGPDFKRLWHQIQAAQTPAEHPIWMMVYFNPIEWGPIQAAMKECGFNGVRPIYTYKENQNYAGTLGWLSSVDIVLLAFRPKMSRFPMPKELDPTQRHNLFSVKAPLQTKFKGSDGKVLNNTQKSTEISEKLATAHSPVFGNALVVCAGSGSEVIGLIRAKQNVVAVERDPAMFNGFWQRMLEFQAVMAKEAEDREAKEALPRRKPKLKPVVLVPQPPAEVVVAAAASEPAAPAPDAAPAASEPAAPVQDAVPAADEKKDSE